MYNKFGATNKQTNRGSLYTDRAACEKCGDAIHTAHLQFPTRPAWRTSLEGAVQKKVEEITDCLQVQRIAHADLRPKNITAKVGERRYMTMSGCETVLSLIDFDMVDEVRYPPSFNPQIPWPTGYEKVGRGDGKVGRGDDRTLPDSWWDALVQPASFNE